MWAFHRFVIARNFSSLRVVLNKPIEVPPQVAQAFLHDMRALLREDNTNKRDEIAARRPHALGQFRGPRERKFRLSDVKQMSLQMKDHAWSFDLPIQAQSAILERKKPRLKPRLSSDGWSCKPSQTRGSGFIKHRHDLRWRLFHVKIPVRFSTVNSRVLLSGAGA